MWLCFRFLFGSFVRQFFFSFSSFLVAHFRIAIVNSDSLLDFFHVLSSPTFSTFTSMQTTHTRQSSCACCNSNMIYTLRIHFSYSEISHKNDNISFVYFVCCWEKPLACENSVRETVQTKGIELNSLTRPQIKWRNNDRTEQKKKRQQSNNNIHATVSSERIVQT